MKEYMRLVGDRYETTWPEFIEWVKTLEPGRREEYEQVITQSKLGKSYAVFHPGDHIPIYFTR